MMMTRMKEPKSKLKAELAEKRKILEKLKKESLKLLKGGKNERCDFRNAVKVAELIQSKKEDIERRNALETELMWAGEEKGRDKREQGKLFEYVKDGECAEIVNALIDGENIDIKDKDMWTPLHIAALNGHEKLVEFLIRMGASIDSKTGSGQTPLHVAVGHEQPAVVEMLYKYGANPMMRDKDRRCPMLLATGEKMKALLAEKEQRFILKHIDNPKVFLEHCDSVMMCAISRQYTHVLPKLIELHNNGIDVGVDSVDGQGNTLLHHAVKNGVEKDLKQLFSLNPFPFVKNKDDKYPVELAKTDKIKDKLKDYEEKYIHIMAENPDTILKMGKELLLYSSARGYTKAVEDLIKYVRHGAININCTDEAKNTPLHVAVWYQRVDVVGLLLRNGAELMVFNNRQHMPADYIRGNSKLIRIFNNFDRIWVSRIINSLRNKKPKE
jgi:ankyrin repeat protein